MWPVNLEHVLFFMLPHVAMDSAKVFGGLIQVVYKTNIYLQQAIFCEN